MKLMLEKNTQKELDAPTPESYVAASQMLKNNFWGHRTKHFVFF